MSRMKRYCSLLALLVAVLLACVPAFAGSAIVGSVAGSMNATIEGQALVPNTVVFTGQSLSVKDGAAVVATSAGARLVFGRDTKASFSQSEEQLTVLLAQGNVSLFAPAGNGALRVQAGSISVVPSSGFKTLCEVAMVGDAIVVTSQKGAVRVQGNGAPVEVAQGKTITISPRTARAPRPQGGGGGMSQSTALQVGAVGAGGLAAILAGVSISRAGSAKDSADKADADAQAATAAANNATSAATAADSDAMAATSAANAATAQAVAVGCALNAFNDQTVGVPSPYVPPSGYTCTYVPIIGD